VTGVPDPGGAPALGDALRAADYTVDAVDGLLGDTARAALQRNETTPALRRTTDGSALATLVRLFLLQAAVDEQAAVRALPGAVGSGLVEASGGEARAVLDCRPYADDSRDRMISERRAQHAGEDRPRPAIARRQHQRQ